MRRIRVEPAIAAAFAVAFVATVAPGVAAAQPLDAGQERCIVKLNSSGRKVAKAVGKEIGRCLKNAAKGVLAGTATECVQAVTSANRVQKSVAKTGKTDAKRCEPVPSFGYAGADAVNASTIDGPRALVDDVFGSDLDAALIATKPGSACQQRVQRAYGKIVDAKLKVYEKCKKKGFKAGSIEAQGDLEACADAVIADTKKVGKSIVKLRDTIADKCAALDLDAVFPGACVGDGDFAGCIDERVECRACLMLNAMDAVAIDCDAFDDGDGGNQSCGSGLPSTTTTTLAVTTTTAPEGTTTSTTVTTSTTLPGATCGDGVPEPGEQCDDGNTEAGDCCSPTCQFESVGSACPDDGNPCTDQACDGAGSCVSSNNTAPCDDGVFCNGADTCGAGTCSGHAGDPCPADDGDGDCAESCNEVAADCTALDPNGAACDDGVFCNGADSCSGGTCNVHAGDPCPGADGDSDCSEGCNEVTDTCSADDADGSTCNDGLFCTVTDTCTSGVCGGAEDPCPGADGDGDCTESCNESADDCTGFDPDGSVCTDGLFCTLTDQCMAGACTGSGDPCPGGDGDGDCTESCDENGNSCTAADPDGATCDDGNAGTGPDTCSSGACSGPLLPCQAKGACIMFVTSTSSDGDLGGLAGADGICQARANLAGLTGTFQAWVCDGVTAPADRSTKNTVPYRRTDGQTVAADWNDLTDGSIQNPINRDESGNDVSATQPFLPWTFVKSDGTCDDEEYLSPGSGPCPAFQFCPLNCASNGGVPGWDSGSGFAQGSKGDINRTDGGWTDGVTGLCSTPGERIYCIEQ